VRVNKGEHESSPATKAGGSEREGRRAGAATPAGEERQYLCRVHPLNQQRASFLMRICAKSNRLRISAHIDSLNLSTRTMAEETDARNVIAWIAMIQEGESRDYREA